MTLTLRYVEIEEVTVENSLHNSSHDCDPVMESFHVIPVDPVENVQGSVGSKSKQVVRSDCLCFSSF